VQLAGDKMVELQRDGRKNGPASCKVKNQEAKVKQPNKKNKIKYK
jgi:hypothetical protein